MPVDSASSAIVGAPPEVGRRGLDRARQAEAQLLHAPRDVQRPGAVAEVALDLADDRRHRVRRELDAALGVEALDREQRGRSSRPGRGPRTTRRGRRSATRGCARAAGSARRCDRGRSGLRPDRPRAAWRAPGRPPPSSSVASVTRLDEQLGERGSVRPRRRPRSPRRRAVVSTRATPGSASLRPASGPRRTRSASSPASTVRVTVSPSTPCTSRLSTREQQVLDAIDGELEARDEAAEHEPADAAIAVGRRELDDDGVGWRGRTPSGRSPAARSVDGGLPIGIQREDRSSSVISKIRRMWGSVQTTLTAPPAGRRRLTAPRSTPSVIESMNVASLRSMTRCTAPRSIASDDRGTQLRRGVEVRLSVDLDDAQAIGEIRHVHGEHGVLDAVRRVHPFGVAAHVRIVLPRAAGVQTRPTGGRAPAGACVPARLVQLDRLDASRVASSAAFARHDRRARRPEDECPSRESRDGSRASPARARSLLTVRAAISSARGSPRFSSDSLTCSY